MEKTESTFLNNHPAQPIKFKLQRKATTLGEKAVKNKYQEYLQLNERTKKTQQRESQLGKSIKSDGQQESLQNLQQRLDELVLDFNEKSAMQAPRKEMEQLSLKINIVKNLITEIKVQKAKKVQNNSENTPTESKLYGRLRGQRNTENFLTKNIFGSLQNQQAEKFVVSQKLNPIGEEALISSANTVQRSDVQQSNSNQVLQFEAKFVNQFEVGADLKFRKEFKNEHQIYDNDLSYMLAKSNIEDLISYKLREDNQRKLLTFDDLRFQQTKALNELHKLEGRSFVKENSYQTEQQMYESMINQPKFFSSPQHRAFEHIPSSPEPRHQKSPKKSLLKTFNRQNTNISRTSKNDSPSNIKSPSKQQNPTGAKNLSLQRLNTLKTNLYLNAKIINQQVRRKSTFRDKDFDELSQDLTSIQESGIQELQKRHSSLSRNLPDSLFLQPSNSRNRLSVANSYNHRVPQSIDIKTSKLKNNLEEEKAKPPLEFKYEPELRKYQYDYNMSMSLPVLNFGLKLYNVQNCNQILQMLNATSNPVLESTLHLDYRYEHTEYELLRRIYRNDVSKAIQYGITQQKIDSRIKEYDRLLDQQSSQVFINSGDQHQPPIFVDNSKAELNDKIKIAKVNPVAQENDRSQSLVEDPNSKKQTFLKKLQEGFIKMLNNSTDNKAKNKNPGVVGVQNNRSKNTQNFLSPTSNDQPTTPKNPFANIFGGVFPKLGSLFNKQPSPSSERVTQNTTNISFPKVKPQEGKDYSKVIAGTVQESDRLRMMRRSRDRGINFVKLNKTVIYPLNLNIERVNVKSDKEEAFRTSATSFMPMPLSVRNIETKAIGQRAKILESNMHQYFNDQLISTRLESINFNSVDEQLRLRINQTLQDNPDADSEMVAGFSSFRVKKQSRCILNENKLTTVVVKGEHVSTKAYVMRNPYAKASFLQVVDPRHIWDGNKRKFASLIQEQYNVQDEMYNPHRIDQMIDDRIRKNKSGDLTDSEMGKSSGPFKGKRYTLQPSDDENDLVKIRTVRSQRKSVSYIAGSKKILSSISKSKTSKMQMRNRVSHSKPVNSDLRMDMSIQEEELSVSSTEGFMMEDLEINNKSLREQIQTQVGIFEQYLRVAMLQQETDHFKAIVANQKLNQNSTADFTFAVEQKFEQQTEILDPTMAYVIASYKKDISSKINLRSGEDSSSSQAPKDLPQFLGNSIKVEQDKLLKVDDEAKRFLNPNSSQSQRSKPPSRLSRGLWQRVTGVQKEMNQTQQIASPTDLNQTLQNQSNSQSGNILIQNSNTPQEQQQEQNGNGPVEILQKRQTDTKLSAIKEADIGEREDASKLQTMEELKADLNKSLENLKKRKLVKLTTENLDQDLKPFKSRPKEVQEWFVHNGSKESNKRIQVLSDDQIITHLNPKTFGSKRVQSNQFKRDLDDMQIKIRNMYNSDSDSISLKSKMSKLELPEMIGEPITSKNASNTGSNRLNKSGTALSKFQLNADHEFFKKYEDQMNAFKRLEANPAAIKDNIKNLLEKRPVRFQSKASKRVLSRAVSRQSNLSKHSRLSVSKSPQKLRNQLTGAIFATKEYDESEEAVSLLVQKTMKHGNEHAVHVEWIERTSNLWDKLHNHQRFNEGNSISNRLVENKKKLEDLIEDNKYQQAVMMARQQLQEKKKIINKSKTPYTSLKDIQKRKKIVHSEEQKIEQLEEGIRQQTVLKDQINDLNLHDQIIQTKLDCRLHENIIYAAQKLRLQPDVRMERELESLRELGRQITQEIFQFIQVREKTVWRTWEYADKNAITRLKKEFDGSLVNMSYSQMCELLYKLINEVNQREKLLDQVQIDENIHELINNEMIEFGSKVLGHHSWVIVNNSLTSAAKRLKFHFSAQQKGIQNKDDAGDSNQIKGPKLEISNVEDGPIGPLGNSDNLNTTDQSKVEESIKITKGGKWSLLKENLTQAEDASTRHIFTNAQEEAEQEKQSRSSKYRNLSAKVNTMLLPNIGSVADSFDSNINSAQQEQADGDSLNQTGKTQAKGSKWLKILQKEEANREKLLEQQRLEREKRLEKLFSKKVDGVDGDSDEDMGRLLDQQAAIKNFDHTLGKIDNYLRAEMQLLSAWNQLEKIETDEKVKQQ